MALTNPQLQRHVDARPPRCLRHCRAKRVPIPGRAVYDIITTWRIACPCGARPSTVLGHPLAKLKSGDESGLFVSPFALRCGRCEQITEFLDTAVDGTGAELGKLAKSKYGNACYRGQGRRQPYPCPGCGKFEGEVAVRLFYEQEYVRSVEQRGIDFPWQNLFSGVHVHLTCKACGKRSMVTDLDTKY